jgi:hypothetical protein
MNKGKCYGCGEPATKEFDGFPACPACFRVCHKVWEDGIIKPLNPIQGAAILGAVITRSP